MSNLPLPTRILIMAISILFALAVITAISVFIVAQIFHMSFFEAFWALLKFRIVLTAAKTALAVLLILVLGILVQAGVINV